MTSKTNKDSVHSLASLKLFHDLVTTARRRTGRLQKELADALSIDAQVLSRKLHGARKSFPTHAEVKQIVKVLADWEAITTRAEAVQLLSVMGLKAESFSEQDWVSAPLNKLELAPAQMSPSSTVPALPLVAQAVPLLPGPTTALIGREYQVELLLNQLQQDSVRLLTLFGMGGVGKTRLALEVAHAVQPAFADGVFFISLLSLREAALIPSTLVQTLQLNDPVAERSTDKQGPFSHEEVLKNFLRHKQLLLVFDNVEQIPDIAPFISNLLQSAQTIKIMVTSRVLLHLYGEYEFDVPPLTICTSDQVTNPAAFEQFAAIRLFIERAQAVNPAFRMTQHNAETISRICTRLDGLPLAIELAAARSKVLPLSKILQWLTDGTGQTFLRSTAHNMLQRHQTLQATLDWSYELLPPSYQALFRHYGVFVGGWTLEAAQAIVLPDNQPVDLADVLEQMEFLIDQSLVKRMRLDEMSSEENTEPRFHLLETIREYALGQLDAAGERAHVQRRHASYYLDLVERNESRLSGPEQLAAMALFFHEQGNLRAALAWATEHDENEIALRISSALGRFWEARMQFHEAMRWIDVVFNMHADSALTARAKLHMGAARLALWEIGYGRARELAQEALTLYDKAGNRAGRTWALFQIGDSWLMQGDYRSASPYLEECLRLLHEQEDWRNYAFTLSRLGALATLQGNIRQARLWLSEAMQLLREYNEPGVLIITLVTWGYSLLSRGNGVELLLSA
ncbi:ATP-binding protein [Dictyobacter kobayashii]|uniref:NB-ARC domain-containing protein n=1 Tax=Dictyobacter kobayashii TaxID=2014872 RepID=A0A402AQ85_9CHLR|nr:NB-ARC domain-containing protein [Dictyobacter kobayashii]GCE21323.1 hypothetical protein KDK_51230 [Dictyobacter kobayashii]